jgi:hypothetical protein
MKAVRQSSRLLSSCAKSSMLPTGYSEMLKTLALPYGSIVGFVAPGAQMIRLVARGPLDVKTVTESGGSDAFPCTSPDQRDFRWRPLLSCIRLLAGVHVAPPEDIGCKPRDGVVANLVRPGEGTFLTFRQRVVRLSPETLRTSGSRMK